MKKIATNASKLAGSGSGVAPLESQDFDELDEILDDLRGRYEDTPQWEFCEGFMAALICCRRRLTASEYLPVLLDIVEDKKPDSEEEGSFASAQQSQRFMDLWLRRWNEVAQSLSAEVKSLDEEAAYQPEVMDVRGAVAALPPQEQADLAGEELPSFAQVWALGFMFAVESWPQEWAAPRDKDAAIWLNSALDAIVAITEDDAGKPEISVFSEDGPPTVSLARLNAFGDAVWSVYDLYELWQNLGPRVETVHKEPTPGRNELCFCGSGKKYKYCHGSQ